MTERNESFLIRISDIKETDLGKHEDGLVVAGEISEQQAGKIIQYVEEVKKGLMSPGQNDRMYEESRRFWYIPGDNVPVAVYHEPLWDPENNRYSPTLKRYTLNCRGSLARELAVQELIELAS